MTATITSLQAGIKVLYPQSAIMEAYFKKSPLFSVIDKNTNWVGSPMHIALTIAPTGGGSHTFATAQANMAGAVHRGFDITHVKDYSILAITTEAIRLTKNDKGALMRGVKAEGDAAIYKQTRALAIDIFRSGSGSRGRIASGADTVTLTLTDPLDAYNFEVGDVLVSNSVDSASGVSTNTGTISGIDYDAGTLTAAAQWHADFDTNDYLFRAGDAGASMQGLAAWVPPTAPSSTPFFGLDRTTSTKLSGVRYDYTVQSDGTMERYLINMATRVSRLGGMPDTAVMNPIRWGNLVNELGDKVRYDRMESTGSSVSMGFDVIKLMGPTGAIKVLSDPNCPYNTLWMLQLDTWCFWTAGEIGWIDDDGKGQWLRQASADAMEARLGWYGNLVCTFPGANGTGSLSALAA